MGDNGLLGAREVEVLIKLSPSYRSQVFLLTLVSSASVLDLLSTFPAQKLAGLDCLSGGWYSRFHFRLFQR